MERLDERVDGRLVAVQEGLQVVHAQPDAVVGDARLREVEGADAVAARAAAQQRAALRVPL